MAYASGFRQVPKAECFTKPAIAAVPFRIEMPAQLVVYFFEDDLVLQAFW